MVAYATPVKSVRKALREGEITKDTYERLTCAACDTRLNTRDDPDDIGTVRACQECGREWREL